MAFFDQPQAAAVLKHGILRRYVPTFASKTGVVRGHRVVYLDAYAGAGSYDDGSLGSPLLAAQTAEKFTGTRTIDGFHVEVDRDLFRKLEQALQGYPNQYAILGSIEDHLYDILGKAHGVPFFGFFDPWGLGVPLRLLQDIIRRRCPDPLSGPPTELLINFSIPGLNRNAGKVRSNSDHAPFVKSQETLRSSIDATLGGSWWWDMWRPADPRAVSAIVHEYAQRLCPPGWNPWVCPVADRINGPHSYYLIFVTRHPHGLWFFNEALSGAREDFYAFCERRQRRDQEPLFELSQLDAQRSQWLAGIRRNLRTLLATGPVRLGRSMTEIYGSALGYARARHLLDVLRDLHAAEEIATAPKHPLVDVILRPGPNLREP